MSVLIKKGQLWILLYTRPPQTPGAMSPRRINLVRWRQIFQGFSLWKLVRITLLAPRILRWFTNFWEICRPLFCTTTRMHIEYEIPKYFQ
jgi:hypothetical protein